LITEHSKPVVFLAFANARDDRVPYLRNLPQEARWLRLALRRAERAGLCQLVERNNATLEDILDVFQDPEYRNRIAVFHYGGHANGYQLLLESASGHSAVVDAGGLAAFLSQQRGLQLVFLNACSTEPQVEELLDAGVAAVLVTWRAVDDEVAKEFAGRFYVGLAGGAELQTAYKEAEGAIRARYGSSTQAMWWVEAEEGETAEDCWPWRLYVRKGAQVVETWNLPDAVGNPLFGLPPLPEGDLPGSPFRHLHWFEREHTEVFFGRGRQIRDLYRRVTSAGMAPIILLHGQSGVGKSSLLAAGLLPRLEASHAIRYLRRDQEQGLLGTLEAALRPEAAVGDTSEVLDLARAWLAREAELGRPLLVILDQVEEVYTRPQADSSHELAEFLRVLQAIFPNSGPRPQGRLILGFRKEWLAEITNRLEDHKLYYNEVFLEPLDAKGIIEAVNGPARSERLRMQYGLTIAEGLPELIADDLLQDPDSPVAPILQILLTKVWQRARERDRTRPHFDPELYQTLKREGILLGDFLDQQLGDLKEWRADVVDSGLALDLLAFHTTPLGTAEQRAGGELQHAYRHQEAVLPELVRQCQERYLLADASLSGRTRVRATRLCHDTLAPLVRARFDESDRPGQRARRILENRAPEWEGDRKGTPLDEPDLALVEAGAPGMQAWTRAEEHLVEASRVNKARRSRMRRVWQGIGAAAMVVIVFMAAIALLQWQSAQSEARNNKVSALLALSLNSVKTNPEQALLLARQAITEANKPLVGSSFRLIQLIAAEPPPPDRAGIDNALHTALQASRLRSSLQYSAAFNTLALSPDNKLLAAGSEDGVTLVWRLDSADPIPSRLSGGGDPVSAVAFHPTAPILATAQKNGSVTLWRTDTLQPAYVFPQQPGVIHDMTYGDMTYSPDGRYLAIVDSIAATVYAADTHGLYRTFTHPEGDMLCGVAFGPDSNRLALSGANGLVQVWDISSDTDRPIYSLRHSPDALTCGLAFSPSNDNCDNCLATAGQDNTVKLWSLKDLSKPTWTFDDAVSTVWRVAFSPDGRLLAGASYDNSAWLWDVTSGETVFHLTGHTGEVAGLVFTSDGKQAITASADHTVRFWDTLVAHSRPILRVAFDPSSTMLATASEDNTAAIWELASNQRRSLLGHTGPVYQAVFDPNQSRQRLATVSLDGTVRLWDSQTGSPLTEPLSLGERLGLSVAMNRKGVVAAGTNDGAVLWQEQGNNQYEPFETELAKCGWVLSLAFHPTDDRYLATACGDGQVAIWDISLSDPQRIREFRHEEAAGEEAINEVIFNQDGSRLVTAGDNRKAQVWDVTTQQVIFETPPQQTRALGVGLTPDGSLLAVAVANGTIKVWDLSAQPKDQRLLGQAWLSLSDHRGPINHLAISPDGRYLATAGGDGMFRIYPLQRSELLRLTQQRLEAQ
jgi:WD40 repeat protein